ncbi:hypothetical protein [Hymenobacter sp. CRA2]|uniref:hypothetical protein n=1 Tax=Hymenobacter sp. CRA2 TaxID=1955620 RepID=UPI00099007D1|nr:hypothetical protein [Hymenobacter sp. CRA2]OON68732.1 hypothetical protein B0919_11110 [Hymenobacter sp. CRA2]
MSELLFDVNLQQLPDEFLTGDWRVTNRVLNRTDPDSSLAQATCLRLEPGQLQVQAAQQVQNGQWSVQRDALLQRPYLDIQLEDERTRALITRLRRSADGQTSQLNLYFLSGMEVLLTQP